MSDEIVARLRACCECEQAPLGPLLCEAADLIEQQAARIKELEELQTFPPPNGTVYGAPETIKLLQQNEARLRIQYSGYAKTCAARGLGVYLSYDEWIAAIDAAMEASYIGL